MSVLLSSQQGRVAVRAVYSERTSLLWRAVICERRKSRMSQFEQRENSDRNETNPLTKRFRWWGKHAAKKPWAVVLNLTGTDQNMHYKAHMHFYPISYFSRSNKRPMFLLLLTFEQIDDTTRYEAFKTYLYYTGRSYALTHIYTHAHAVMRCENTSMVRPDF
jgi:hypothetical protein